MSIFDTSLLVKLDDKINHEVAMNESWCEIQTEKYLSRQTKTRTWRDWDLLILRKDEFVFPSTQFFVDVTKLNLRHKFSSFSRLTS